MRRFKDGFTLIELLVVIAIIGVLASIVLAALNTARSKARDANRVAEMQQISKALTLYYDDNGSYPPYVGSDLRQSSCFSGGGASDSVGQWSNALNVLVTDGYLPSLPNDPVNNGVPGQSNVLCYTYHINTGGASPYDSCYDAKTNTMYYDNQYGYIIYFTLENPNSNYPKQN